MSQPPDWTLSLTEWALLRDQLIFDNQPSLSTPSRLSSVTLLGLAATAAIANLIAAFLRARSLPAGWRPFEPDANRSLSPNLPLLLPLLFAVHAALNIGSLSSLLTDVNRLKFRGRTNAIQQFNYSLLICAGILVTWAIVSGLPPYRIGLCGPSGGVLGARGRRWTLRPTAFQLTMAGLTALVVAFVAPLAWIILSTQAVERMNTLEDGLLRTVEGVLQTGAPTVDATAAALTQLDGLQRTADALFASVRALAAVHLLLALAILAGCAAATIAVVRALRRQTDASRASRSLLPALPHAWRAAAAPERPPPALLLHTRTEHDPELLCKHPVLPQADDAVATECPSEEKLLLAYANTVKAHALVVLVVGVALAVLNLCILTNVFRYPSKMSIGEMMILTLKFSSWVWNGSISPVLGITNCLLALKKNKASHKIGFGSHHGRMNNNNKLKSMVVKTGPNTPSTMMMKKEEENEIKKKGGWRQIGDEQELENHYHHDL